MRNVNPLYQHALIHADFPLRVPTPDQPLGSAFEFAQWLQSELAARGVDCTPPEDVHFGNAINCTVDGDRLTVVLSVNDFIDEPTGFHLDIQLPGESWWSRWRRGSEAPVWWEAAGEWAATIEECLATDARIHDVTWYPVAYPVVPLPSYPTATSRTPNHVPPIRWYHRLVLLHNRAAGCLGPIVVVVFAGAIASLIHPLFGILAYAGFAFGTLWFCLMMFGVGGEIIAAGVQSGGKREEQGGRSIGATIWGSILIAGGVVVCGYFLALPFFILQSILAE